MGKNWIISLREKPLISIENGLKIRVLYESEYQNLIKESEYFMHKRLGMRIKAQRNRLGLSQEKLAEICGVHQSNIARVEAGQIIKIKFKKKLEETLKINLIF